MNWETYIAFGDSITIGARSYLGYPEYTGILLERATKKSWNVINCSKSGFTVADLLRSIDSDPWNFKNNAASVCTLLIGTNDIKNYTDLEDFEIAYNLLLLKLRLLTDSANIKVFQIPDFPMGVMYPYTIQMNESIPAYNKVIEKLAQNHLVKYHSLSFQDDELFDGVHLNQKGCKTTADYFAKIILLDRGL